MSLIFVTVFRSIFGELRYLGLSSHLMAKSTRLSCNAIDWDESSTRHLCFDLAMSSICLLPSVHGCKDFLCLWMSLKGGSEIGYSFLEVEYWLGFRFHCYHQLGCIEP